MNLHGGTLFRQHLAGILRGLVDDEAHLGPRWLKVWRDAVVLEFLRGGRADGDDGERRQADAEVIRHIHLFCNLKEVDDLNRGHEENDVHIAVDDRKHALAQRTEIDRESPPVDRHFDHRGAPRGKAGNQIWIGGTILLHGDSHVSEFATKG